MNANEQRNNALLLENTQTMNDIVEHWETLVEMSAMVGTEYSSFMGENAHGTPRRTGIAGALVPP